MSLMKIAFLSSIMCRGVFAPFSITVAVIVARTLIYYFGLRTYVLCPQDLHNKNEFFVFETIDENCCPCQ